MGDGKMVRTKKKVNGKNIHRDKAPAG